MRSPQPTKSRQCSPLASGARRAPSIDDSDGRGGRIGSDGQKDAKEGTLASRGGPHPASGGAAPPPPGRARAAAGPGPGATGAPHGDEPRQASEGGLKDGGRTAGARGRAPGSGRTNADPRRRVQRAQGQPRPGRSLPQGGRVQPAVGWPTPKASARTGGPAPHANDRGARRPEPGGQQIRHEGQARRATNSTLAARQRDGLTSRRTALRARGPARRGRGRSAPP